MMRLFLKSSSRWSGVRPERFGPRLLFLAGEPEQFHESFAPRTVDAQHEGTDSGRSLELWKTQKQRRKTEAAARMRELTSLESLEKGLEKSSNRTEWSKSSEQERQTLFVDGQAILNRTCGENVEGRWQMSSGWGPFRTKCEIMFDDGIWKARTIGSFSTSQFAPVGLVLQKYRRGDPAMLKTLESLSTVNSTFPGPLPSPFVRSVEKGRPVLQRKQWEDSELTYNGQRLVIDANTGNKIVTGDSSGRVSLRMAGELPGEFNCFAAEIDPSTRQATRDTSFSFQKLSMHGADIDALLAPGVTEVTVGIWTRPMLSLLPNSRIAANDLPLFYVRLRRPTSAEDHP